jgi:hypothetical protein
MLKDTGSGGDSYTYRHSETYKKIRQGEWLSCPHADHIEGVLVKPFVNCCRYSLPNGTNILHNSTTIVSSE